MKKKLFTALLAASMALTILPAPVYATDVGQSGDSYIEGENREDEGVDNEGPASFVEPGEVMSKEDFLDGASGDSESDVFASEDAYTEPELDLSGKGQLRIAIKVSEGFYENIQVTLYNRDTREEIKVPVYASNKWVENVEIPAGRYLVSNVLAGGDSIESPKWIFEMGSSVDVDTNGNASLNVNLLKGPDFTGEPSDKTDTPSTDVTDTDNTQEQQKEELTVGQQALNFLKSLVTGSNFVILAVLAVSSVGYLYLKKKREG